MKTVDFDSMRRLAADIRIETIKALAEVGFGHIGGSVSMADALAVLYGGVMNIDPQNPEKEDRDRFVLSKGHCGPALYAVLALKGYFPMEWLKTVNKLGTRLPSHADMQKTPGVDMTTGSLGQGISAAVGIALGNKLLGRTCRCFCMIGDGECNEGQVWEAVEAAVHHEMDKMYILVDWNKKQLDGTLEQILNPVDLADKFRAFGCDVRTARGDDVEAIYQAIEEAGEISGKPHVIILDTQKGAGCDFAEKVAFNHYMTIDWEMAETAIAEIERRLAEGCYPGGEPR